jgi:sugar lactone lactonase YvrE
VTVAADGSVYIADTGNQRVRRVGTDGVITTVAGTGKRSFSGDGGPALRAGLSPVGVAVTADGILYIADWSNARVRRVDGNGGITTVVGTGKRGFSGDGGPAALARLNDPEALAVGPDGALYIADSRGDRIRRVGSDGVITTVAGTGTRGFSGDGGPAVLADLSAPSAVAVTADGALYIADSVNARVRRVGPDGVITTVAGTGERGFSGDGGPAVRAQLFAPSDIVATGDGSIYVADPANNRIRAVDRDGLITTMFGPHPAS